MRPIRPFLLACAAGALLLPACADDAATSIDGGESTAVTSGSVAAKTTSWPRRTSPDCARKRLSRAAPDRAVGLPTSR